MCYTILNDANRVLVNEDSKFDGYYTKEQLFNIAYFIFIYGFDDINLSYKYYIGKPFQYNLIEEQYHKILDKAIPLFKDIQKLREGEIYNLKYGFVVDKIDVPKIKYRLFSGHNSRLPHYFRHLYQIIKFVLQQDDKIITDKYAYLKIVRAQLSNYEQVLVYYNAQSIFGKPWLDEKFLTEWRMIKNMPLYIANFGPLPKDVLGEKNSKGQKLFEIDEIS